VRSTRYEAPQDAPFVETMKRHIRLEAPVAAE
jgi:hypothetical protein